MIRIICLLTLIFVSNSPLASEGYINLNAFLDVSPDQQDSLRPDDIGYLYTTPQYEENQDATNPVVIEYYFGSYDESPEAQQRLQYLAEMVEDERKSNRNFHPEILSISAKETDDSKVLEEIIKTLKLEKSTKKFESIPQTVFFNSDSYNTREPNAFSPGQKFWTFTRFTIGAIPTFAALTLVEGVAPGIAASVAFWPGAASGAITYFNGSYGKFITNGSWSKWVLESDKKFAKILRGAMGLNVPNFEKHLLNNKKFFAKARPDLYLNDPELFEQKVRKVTTDIVENKTNRIAAIAKKLTMADEYVKWFATEVAFTTFALKIPQAVAGIGGATSFAGAAADILTGSTFGMLAQGPGDIAIQKRKLQKVDELLEAVTLGKVAVENKDALIAEIKKLKTPGSEHIIGKNSHKALKRIENWARSRASMLSFFSVTGVGLELMGIPMARPILIATGIGGAIYYGNVNGWLTKEKMKQVFTKAYFNKIKNKYSFSSIVYRSCAAKFKAIN